MQRSRACSVVLEAHCCRARDALPSPTKPRPAGVWSLEDLPEAGKPAAGWGGVGGGVVRGAVIISPHHPLPTLPPSRGEQTEFSARFGFHPTGRACSVR